MRLPRVRLTVRRLMLAVAGIAVGLGLWLGVGPMLGFILFLGLAQSGVADTRIGRELGYVIVHTVGVGGLNTSGRPGDDPFVGWENFPWLLLSLVSALAGAWNGLLVMRRKAQRTREHASSWNA
jgi:hypothetical protein